MSDTSYFDAYMRGERSRDYKLKVAGFGPILISLTGRSMPNLMAYDLTGVQPMTRPTGQTFTLRLGPCTINNRITISPNTTIRSERFRPTYMRNS